MFLKHSILFLFLFVSVIQPAIVTNGPVSVAIKAYHPSFMFYSGGVFDDASCGTDVDHFVVIVGYGVDSGEQYFTVS